MKSKSGYLEPLESDMKIDVSGGEQQFTYW
jgi:hypothetical protein